MFNEGLLDERTVNSTMVLELVLSDKDIVYGGTYYYRIQNHKNVYAGDWSNEISITYVESFTGYIIERKTTKGEWIEIGRVPKGTMDNLGYPANITVVQEKGQINLYRNK